jgi:hypothetical protein
VSNRSLADPSGPGIAQGAALLDNFFPTASAVRLRRGLSVFAAMPSDPVALFAYRNGTAGNLFSATGTNIYEITTGTVVSRVESQKSGDWTTIQFATSGGVFLVGVNGTDPGFLFDGTAFSNPALSFSDGTNTYTSADMSYVWTYKNRLWFARKDSTDAWYLNTLSIGGSTTYFPLGGVFGQGGSLLFGHSWSLDNGASGGLSEQCIFVTDQGEVAVYQGDDPDTLGAFQRVGVYRIGTPLGKNAFFRAGGDLAIATSVGLVPLSKAISLDVTALSVATISYNIADAWTEAVQQRGLTGWCCTLWPEQKIAFVSPPDSIQSIGSVVYPTNTETGAWCRFTGWRAACMCVFNGQLYIGSPGGFIYAALSSGLDGGVPYTGAVMPMFEDLGSPASLKVAKLGRTVVRSLKPVDAITLLHTDFDTYLAPPPDATVADAASLWGSSQWGVATWGSIVPDQLSQDWQSLGGTGYTLTVSCQVTSGDVEPLDSELIRQDLTFTAATIVT